MTRKFPAARIRTATPSSTVPTAILLCFFLVLAAGDASASTWNIMQPWRIATEAGFSSFWLPSGQTCQNDNSQRCVMLPVTGGEVYTADWPGVEKSGNGGADAQDALNIRRERWLPSSIFSPALLRERQE